MEFDWVCDSGYCSVFLVTWLIGLHDGTIVIPPGGEKVASSTLEGLILCCCLTVTLLSGFDDSSLFPLEVRLYFLLRRIILDTASKDLLKLMARITMKHTSIMVDTEMALKRLQFHIS